LTNQDTETLLEFPCDFPVKAMGLARDDEFPAFVSQIVQRHAPSSNLGTLSSKISSAGKYISVTVTVLAENKQQLDSIYMELTGSPRVVMAL
jgi:putative lipoic acid-binding regulatory protein